MTVKIFLLTLVFPALCLCKPGDPFIFETTELPTNSDGSINRRLMASVGNGHLATTVLSDTIFINGLYNGRLGSSHRARIESMHAANLEIEGCDMSQANFTYRLETKRGVFVETIYCGMTGLAYITYAHNVLTSLLVTEVHFWNYADQSATITFQSLAGDQSEDIDFDDLQELDVTTFYKRGYIKEPETDDSERTEVHVYYNQLLPESLTLDQGEQVKSVVFLSAMGTDQDKVLFEFENAKGLLEQAPDGELLGQGHIQAWEEIWQHNIILEGDNVDLFLQEAIIGAWYYLYSSLPSSSNLEEEFFSLSPGGLANGKKGNDYQGHVFWDTETWMLPAVLLFRPELVKASLNYRVRRMDEAIKRAADTGYQGARYPWESGFTGAEITSDICPLCRDNQQHITGDISFAVRSYIAATRDLIWLTSELEDGAGVMPIDFVINMAKFWKSRPTFNETKGLWEINDVMPPDEHQDHARNSIYTNLVANYAVSTARWLACMGSYDETALVPEEWFDVVDNLVFTFNKEKRYHEEFEGFDEQYTTGTLDPRGIKQADVVLLNYPLLWDMPRDVKMNDLALYEDIVNPNGPAMTWAIHAINWLELGAYGRAAELFNKSYTPYVRPPFNIWTEVASGIGAVNFLTGAGGFLQSLIYGFGGIRNYPFYLEIDPPAVFPAEGVTKLKFTGMNYLNTKFDLEITETELVFQCLSNYAIIVTIKGEAGVEVDFTCPEPKEFRFSRQKLTMQVGYPSACDPPRDSLNVDYGS